MRVLGTETEYGILAPDAPDLHPAALSAAVVAAWEGPATRPAVAGDWEIPLEDPHNRVLANGARLYVDHAHPEYATPETTTPRAAVVHDRAGDEIVRRSAATASQRLGVELRVFKNNTDGKGASYGFHENYLVPRSVPWEGIVRALLTHLVTRIPLTGAGRVGLGTSSEAPGFQLSQRADFFEQLTGLETTVRRPLVNARDEPHANPARWRRLHVIAGDANLADTSRLLTLGTTAAVLDGVEAGVLPIVDLFDPMAAVRTVSRDLTLREALETSDGPRLSALEVQEATWEVLARHSLGDPEVMRLWRETLDQLRQGAWAAAGLLDWAAKLALLEHFRKRDGLAWDAPRLAAVDLQYADLDPARSIHQALSRSGRLATLIAAAEIEAAIVQPPPDTRAALRGGLVSQAPDALDSVDWALVTGHRRDGSRVLVRLPEPLEWPDLDAVLADLGR